MWNFKKNIYKLSEEEDIVFTPIPAVYQINNSIYGENSDFAIARDIPVLAVANLKIGSYYNLSNYENYRFYAGFDTTAITTATIATITIDLENNQLTFPDYFVVMITNTTLPANHVWTTADYNEGVLGIIASDQVLIDTITLGVITFNLNATALAYINGSNDATFSIVNVTHDLYNEAPDIIDGIQHIQGFLTDVYLNHY